MNKYFDNDDVRFFKITAAVGIVVFSIAMVLL